MWIPPLIQLFLALVLIPDPGVSQFGAQVGRCKDCRAIENKEDPTKLKEVINKKVKKYDRCPHSVRIRFQLESGVICAIKDLSWVKELMECLDGDRKCLDDTSSSSQKEFSKGTNEKPSTTTTSAPTTVPVTSMKPSTQSPGQNIGQSPTASPAAPSDLNITPLDSDKGNINLAQGKDKSVEPQNVEDQHSKMKHMQTAIISLIVIVLVLVAVGVGVYCRKKAANKFSTPCGSRPEKYMAAPSEDSIVEVNAG